MIVTIGGTYAPFCMRMASLFFKVRAQGHKLNIVVVVRKKYIMIGSARTANFDTHSYLKLKRKFIFCQGKRSYLNASL